MTRPLLVIILGVLSLVKLQTQEPYPPEGQPIVPTITVGGQIFPAPDVMTAVYDTSLVTDKLIVVTDQDFFANQTSANTYCNSLITNDNLTLSGDPLNHVVNRLAGCVIIHYTAVNGDADFTWGQTNTQTLGAQYGADLRQFITRSSNYCGLGYIDAWRSGVQFTYSWVSKSCAPSNYSNIHEEGHNRGANHDIPNANSSFYAWAHGFCDSTHSRRDVMTYPNPCGGSRGPYFSNPNISPYGTPFGNVLTMDNARVVRDTALAISNMRQPVGNIPVNYPR